MALPGGDSELNKSRATGGDLRLLLIWTYLGGQTEGDVPGDEK